MNSSPTPNDEGATNWKQTETGWQPVWTIAPSAALEEKVATDTKPTERLVPREALLHDDAGKLPWELLPLTLLTGAMEVLEFGAHHKYRPFGWKEGMDYTRLIGSIKRHLLEFEQGHDTDAESGCLHIDHLICCAIFLSHYVHHPDQYSQFDNRFNSHSPFTRKE